LGGFISTLVAGKCHDQDIKTYLWNGRSARSIADVIAGQIRTQHKSGHYETPITVFISSILRPIIALMLSVVDWNVDVTATYKSLPETHKNFYLIRSTKDQRNNKKDDAVMPYCSSLEKNGVIKHTISTIIKSGNIDNAEEIAFYAARRKCYIESPADAHPMSEAEILCRGKPSLSVYNLFCLFASAYVSKRAEQDKQLEIAGDRKSDLIR